MSPLNSLSQARAADSSRLLHAHLAVIAEDDGQYSAIVLNLPGVGSCGSTADQAVANAASALRETIASYRDEGREVPWTADYDVPADAVTEWVDFDA